MDKVSSLVGNLCTRYTFPTLWQVWCRNKKNLLSLIPEILAEVVANPIVISNLTDNILSFPVSLY